MAVLDMAPRQLTTTQLISAQLVKVWGSDHLKGMTVTALRQAERDLTHVRKPQASEHACSAEQFGGRSEDQSGELRD